MGFFNRIPDKAARTPAGGNFAPLEGVTTDPARHIAPKTRELRAQAVHRLQVGIFGLAGMLLLVSLANVIMDRAQQADESTVAASTSASTSAANDPLVDMGVAPELPRDGENAAAKPVKSRQNR